VLILFVAVSLALWVSGNGIPFGYDAIEVYYTYLIGYNGATFPNVNPLMADLAVSPDSTAHPYYYTHHPNLFAHLLSQGLIRAGVANLPAHNLVAIGIMAAGLFWAARVLRKLGGPPLAAATLLVFSFHYVGVITWSNHLLRAMAFPLFWLNVYAVQRYVEQPSRRHLAWSMLGAFAVFLNDLTLGPYLLVVVILLVWQTGRSFRQKAVFSILCCLAAGAALGIWLTVLVSTLGWSVVSQDIAYTYVGRNNTELISNPGAVASFYRNNNIVFWGSFVPSGNRLALIREAYSTAFTLGHGALVLLLYPLSLGILLGTVLHRLLGRGRRFGSERLIAVAAVIVAAIKVALSWRVPGLLPSWGLGGVPGPVVGAIAVVVVLGLVTSGWPARRREVGTPDRHSGANERIAGLSRVTSVPTITLRNYIVAMVGATLLMTYGWLGGFTAGLVWGYKPGLVFLEDVVLAAVLVWLAKALATTSWPRVPRAAAGLVLVGILTYWLAYQVKQLHRYPPTEIAIAPILRGNESLKGTTFVAGGVHHIIWYYIGGRAHHIPGPDQNPLDTASYMFFNDWKARAETYREPQFLMCARMHTQPMMACLAWLQALERASLVDGRNYEADDDLNYLIFRFPDGYWRSR
jgi:hypothetical protein